MSAHFILLFTCWGLTFHGRRLSLIPFAVVSLLFRCCFVVVSLLFRCRFVVVPGPAFLCGRPLSLLLSLSFRPFLFLGGIYPGGDFFRETFRKIFPGDFFSDFSGAGPLRLIENRSDDDARRALMPCGVVFGDAAGFLEELLVVAQRNEPRPQFVVIIDRPATALFI